MPSRDPKLTSEEVAEIYRVDVQTVWKMVREGRLHAVRVGRHYRFSQSDLDRYDKANKAA